MSEIIGETGMNEDQGGYLVGVGELLRATREELGLTMVDVAQALKLTQRQVEALETERFDALPGAAFARGFLRNYARYLGLDPEPLLAALAQTAGVGAPELAPVCNAEGTMPTGDRTLRPAALSVALVALLLLGAVVAGWYFDWFRPPAQEAVDAELLQTPVAPAPVTPVPPPVDMAPVVIPDDAPAGGAEMATLPETPAAPADGAPLVPAEPAVDGPAQAGPPAAEAEPPAAAADAAAPVPPDDVPHRLVFRFETESWVEVRDASGDIIFSRVNRPGSVQEVQGEPPFALVIGNAKGVSLEYDGKRVDLAPHTRVSVARLSVK